MTVDVLRDRALNRATLERQLLLTRTDMEAVAAVDHLVGLQAQVPRDPYVALWSRLDGFRPADLADAMVDRRVGRIVVMRGTIHLVTADDALAIPPVIQPVLDAELRRHRDHAPVLADLDLKPVLRFARRLLREPHTVPELRAALGERFGQDQAAALAYACRNHLALVQVPPRGVWGERRQVTLATAEAWFDRPMERRPSIDDLVLRYLAAFGPASASDVSAWSRLTGMAEVMDRLRPRLRAFRTESGRELLDLPDAPRPDASTPAPVRFLPEYDNVLLSHADRSRFGGGPELRGLWDVDRPGIGSVLHDGVLRASWTLEGSSGDQHLRVLHLPSLPVRARRSIEAEGRRLLRFLTEDRSATDVRLVTVAD
jgi:hypothetical protein